MNSLGSIFFSLLAILFVSCNLFDSSTSDDRDIIYEHDYLVMGNWWERGPNDIVNLDVVRSEIIAFSLYTVHNFTLKLSVQTFPLYQDELKELSLEVYDGHQWIVLQNAKINEIGWLASFRIDNWDSNIDHLYRVSHPNGAIYQGVIRKDPVNKEEISIAILSCNSYNGIESRDKYVKSISYLNPDLVFFAGDQVYYHQQHTAGWLKFGMQFRELFRNRPCIILPDDHDIGQANLWGENGKISMMSRGEDGGYIRPAEYVNMVQKAQTSHLPDPYDPTPVNQNIQTYYTSFVLGEVDFAIIEDRKFKSAPLGNIPSHNGNSTEQIKDPDIDFSFLNDDENLSLLGKRQLSFLDDWSKNNPNHFKVVLSQTGFSGTAHLLGAQNKRVIADLDTNGWPKSGRNKALEKIKQANAIHLGGDQHLGVVIKHGIIEHKDGPWSFLAPAIANDVFERWWWPLGSVSGENKDPSNALPWTGDYLDGFGNKITMYAYANPNTQSNGEGFGYVKINKDQKTVTFECWPRFVDLPDNDSKQFEGWPLTISIK